MTKGNGLIKRPSNLPPAAPVKKGNFDFSYKTPAVEPVQANDKPVAVEPVQTNDKPVAVEPVQTNDKPVAVEPVQTNDKPVAVEKKAIKRTPTMPRPLSVGTASSTKTLKVPTIVHTQINLLGSFMDENKTYMIIQKLIDAYIENQLTTRQQRQFNYMLESFEQDK